MSKIRVLSILMAVIGILLFVTPALAYMSVGPALLYVNYSGGIQSRSFQVSNQYETSIQNYQVSYAAPSKMWGTYQPAPAGAEAAVYFSTPQNFSVKPWGRASVTFCIDASRTPDITYPVKWCFYVNVLGLGSGNSSVGTRGAVNVVVAVTMMN
jgi:hypothetical protein